MLTTIPFFREIIVSSFECPHCGYKNSSVQYGGVIQDRGYKITLKVTNAKDMNRTVVKSETATIYIPELELEIPPQTQRGTLNTIEGVLVTAIDGLRQDQPLRRVMNPTVASKIDQLIDRLEKYRTFELGPFTFIIDDPAGNSFIENPYAPKEDPNLHVVAYVRTPEQCELLGIPYLSEDEIQRNEQMKSKESAPLTFVATIPHQTQHKEDRNMNTVNNVAEDTSKQSSVEKPTETQTSKGETFSEWRPKKSNVGAARLGILSPSEAEAMLSKVTKVSDVSDVMTFPSKCLMCNHPVEEKMLQVNVPFFKEVVVMSSACDVCGYKNNEIKSGGPIAPLGRKITLKVIKPEDLCRDVLKSDTASLYIPEVDLRLAPGSLGGKFTTVEGLVQKIIDDLKNYPFVTGDSATDENKIKFRNFLQKLESLLKLEQPFTIVIDDPVANSYVQSLTAPTPDPQITIEDYQRTWEQNEELGLNDINTETYEKLS